MAENDGVIELDLDLPEVKQPEKGAKTAEEKVVEKTPETPVVNEADAVAALKKQLEEKDTKLASAEARLVAADATARQAIDNAAKSQTDVRSANLTMVNNAIDSVKREQEILEANLANAMAAGDFPSAAKIQTQISTAAAKLVQLETGKEAMEAEAKLPVKRMEPPRDPVEALASQLSPRSAEWVRSHPEYARDPVLLKRMSAAHDLAITGGFTADTDAYFENVENTLGIRKAETPADDALSDAAQAASGRRAAPPAAPVSRSGTGSGKRPNTVTLTAEEREFAALSGMTDREYAEQKLRIMKEKAN